MAYSTLSGRSGLAAGPDATTTVTLWIGGADPGVPALGGDRQPLLSVDPARRVVALPASASLARDFA